MRLRALSAAPAIFVGAAFLLIALVQSPPTHRLLLDVEIETVKLLALAGCIAAGSALDPGDHLRRAWLLNAASYVLLVVRDATRLAIVADAIPLGLGPMRARAALLLIANVCGVASSWKMARTFHVATIELPGSVWRRRAIVGGMALVALAITGPSLLADMGDARLGDATAIVRVLSGLGDVLSLCLAAPVLLTALALRGGLLYFPWALLTASALGWLFYDAISTLGDLVAADHGLLGTLEEIFRALACTYGCAAGFAQRAIVVQDEKDSATLPAV